MELLKYYLVLQILIITFNVENAITKTLVSNETGNNEDVLLEIQELKKEIEDIRTDGEELKKLKKSHASMSHNLIALGEEMQALDLDREDPGPNDVYFTVSLINDIKGLAPGGTVRYNHIVSNSGNGYDDTTGIFTAPTSGVYIFAFFCNSLKAKTTDLVMMQNGRPEANCMVEPAFDGEDETGGDVYITRLNIGDRMWVEVFHADSSTTDLQRHLNTFSGILIHG